MKAPQPQVVIVGAGFGGLAAARKLLDHHVSVELIDRNNYHLFQPLLYQVSAAYLAAEEIAKPVRAVFRRYRTFSFRMTEVERIDFEHKSVSTSLGPISYDYLVIAVGARPDFRNIPGLAKHAFSLKYLEDALEIRSHILTCFERAVCEADTDRRRALLTFAIGGGGSAGVEMAGALAELVNQVLVRDYPRIAREEVRILLLEASPRILPDLPKDLGRAAIQILTKKGVTVKLGTIITGYDGSTVDIRDADAPLRCQTLIWTGGIKGAALTDMINSDAGQTAGSGGRIRVTDTLQLPGHPEVYAIGDAAHVHGGDGPVPMVAPAAVQTAESAAANILRAIAGREAQPFGYRSPGALATIGRNAAVAKIRGVELRGFLAWMVWLIVHLIRLVGFRNRIIVLINWIWDYLFFERASRLVFGRYIGAELLAQEEPRSESGPTQ